MGKYNPEEMKRLEEEKTAQDKEETELASKIKVDDRCEVKMPGNPTRRGTVKYVGEVNYYLLILQTAIGLIWPSIKGGFQYCCEAKLFSN